MGADNLTLTLHLCRATSILTFRLCRAVSFSLYLFIQLARAIPVRCKNIDEVLAAAHLGLVSAARFVAIRLVARSFAGDIAAAPAFIALFDAGKIEVSAVASILAFGNCQSGVTTLFADALLQHR